MRKQLKASVIIDNEIQLMMHYLKTKGINISYEFRELIKKLYEKIKKEDETNIR